MSRCKDCGTEVYASKRICSACLDKWSRVKATFFDEAVAKFGKLSATTLKPIQKHVKKSMNKWEKAGRPATIETAK